MARSIADIQKGMLIDVNATPELNGSLATPPFTLSQSKRAIYRLWTFIIATAINVLENIMDVYQAFLETIAAKAAAGSVQWVQDKMFKFQYDVVNPQIIQIIDTVPTYVPVDPTKRIITRCAVKTTLSNNVSIKIAQLEPPAACDAAMIASAQGYINTIGVGGINYSVTSGDPDRLYIAADVYFNGQYSATILDSISDAINDLLANPENFGGAIKISDLESAIKNVIGVNDVILTHVSARPNSIAYPGTDLVLNSQIISRLWNNTTGYIIPEDTAGYELVDSLNLIAQ
jgi:hypothetical protein